MSGKEDFTLTLTQCRMVLQHRKKIMELFGVSVKLPDLALGSGSDGSSTAPVWVEICGEKANAMKAKSYTLSMFSDITAVEMLPKVLLDSLDFIDIERETQASLTRIGPEELQIQGDTQMNVAKASSIILHKHQQFKNDGRIEGASTRLNSADPNPLTHTNGQNLQNEGVDNIPELTRRERMLPRGQIVERMLPSGQIVVPRREDSGVQSVFVPVRHDMRGDRHVEQITVPGITQNIGDNVIVVPPRQTWQDPKSVKPYTAGRCRDNDVIDVPPRTYNLHTDRIERGLNGKQPISTKTNSDQTGKEFDPNSKPSSSQPNTEKPVEGRTEEHPPHEYDTVKKAEDNPPIAKKDLSILVNTGKTSFRDPVTVEIMLKLGYKYDQIQQIIHQLGPKADQNDILGALVNQNTNNTKQEKLGGAVESEDRVIAPSGVRDMSDSSQPVEETDNLRSIIIDGSNVAMSYGNKDVFACKGIEIVVNWFLERGHREIFVFVPNWRKESAKPDTPITDQHILEKLEKLKILVYTPSRRIGGRRIVCYDDRYIIKTAALYDGIVVSNDNFRDLQNEQSEFKKVIEERLLLYSFVGNQFMPPDDPLGRNGPRLDNFLCKRPTAPDHPPQICPYGKKCTYGNKCKYYHPERQGTTQKSISERLKEQDETRKRSELVKALLNDQRDEHTTPNMHNGYNTEPIPIMHERLDTRRSHFLTRYKTIYGEETIRRIFALYPDEFNERHLHQRLRQNQMPDRSLHRDPSVSVSGRAELGQPLHGYVPGFSSSDNPRIDSASPSQHFSRPQGAASNHPGSLVSTKLATHIHPVPEGYFYSQPLPRQPTSHHEERFESVGKSNGHRMQNAAAAAGGGRQAPLDRDWQEAFAQVSLGNSATPNHHPSSMYRQHSHLRDMSSHSAPISRPDPSHMRLSDTMEQRSTNSDPIRLSDTLEQRSRHSAQIHRSERRSYSGTGMPSQWHSAGGSTPYPPHHPSAASNPGHPPYQSMYPYLGQGANPGYTTHEPAYTPNPRSMYPNLPMRDADMPPDRTVEMPHPVGVPNIHGSNPPVPSGQNNHRSNPPAAARPNTDQSTSRSFFMKRFKALYGEEKIRKVFEMHPDETNELMLHQQLRFM